MNNKRGKRKNRANKTISLNLQERIEALTAEISSPISPTQPTQTQSLPQSPSPEPKPRRSGLVLALEFLGIVAALATTVAGTGYALEKWQETNATVDFSGEIDQKKPFSIPLIIKNPSTIFSAHSPSAACWIEVEYLNPTSSGHALMAAEQPSISVGLAIPPGQSRNFLCNMPDNFTLRSAEKIGDVGEIIPIKQAEMIVKIEYDTWLPWPKKREVLTQFVMLQPSTGYRWVKGQWAISPVTISWPPGSPPHFQHEKPKLPE